MRKALFFCSVALLTCIGLARADSVTPNFQLPWTEVVAITIRGDPNADATPVTAGFSLNRFTSLHPVAICPTNFTVSGTNLDWWYYSPAAAANTSTTIGWGKTPSQNSVTVSSQGNKDPYIGPEFTVTQPFGRGLWACNPCGCSGASAWSGVITIGSEGAQR